MLALETNRDAFPSEAVIESRECQSCNRVGFYPQFTTSVPSECEKCHREGLIECLEERGGVISRADAFSRIESLGYLPVHDPMVPDDVADFVTDVEVDHGPNGQFIKSITHIVERDCPECGYDRADRTRWQHFTFEQGHHVDCRACGHIIEEESSL